MARSKSDKPKAPKKSKAAAKTEKAPETAIVLTPVVEEPKAEPNKGGRPCSYTTELGNAICDHVSNRVSVWKICAMDGMPSEDTIYRWKRTIPEFSENYARAVKRRAEARQDRIDFIAEQCGAGTLKPDVARIMIDAEKWQMSKEQPKKYGDKLEIDTPEDGVIGKAMSATTVAIEELIRRGAKSEEPAAS